MAHRGPDDRGLIHESLSILGNRRLAIIDLSERGRQPMYSADGRFAVVYNGEIYNYRELRKNLEEEGVVFQTECDTEVLLECFAKYGPEVLNRFNGMFTIAIWDRKMETLFVARDRFGIKPLYFYDNENYVVFASEIKAILPLLDELKPNDGIIYDFLAYGRVDHLDNTFFQDIKRFPASHYAYISADAFNLVRWYDLDEEISRLQNSPEFKKRTVSDHVEAVQAILFDAVKLRLRSDVPVGSCLSGGVDSSSIVSVATRFLPSNEKDNFETYSAVYGQWFSFDEKRYIDIVTNRFGIKSNFTTPTIDDWVEMSSTFIYHQEEPVTGTSPFSQFCVMKLAHSHNAKVLLDGQGGDEILAGYEYMAGYDLAGLLVERKLGNFFRELLGVLKKKRVLILMVLLYQFAPEALRQKVTLKNDKLLERRFTNRFRNRRVVEPLLYFSKNLNEALVSHVKFKLQHLLRWEDKNSMAFSIETRVPFLDHNLVCYVLALPSSYKIQRGNTKWVLRQALRNILPKEISERTDKIGFATPEDLWLNQQSLKFFQPLITNPHPLMNDYVDVQQIREFLETNVGRFDLDTCRHLFKILCLDLWLKLFFGQSATIDET